MRMCQCAGCGELTDCQNVRDAWYCMTCMAQLATPPEVTPDDGGAPVADSEPEGKGGTAG